MRSTWVLAFSTALFACHRSAPSPPTTVDAAIDSTAENKPFDGIDRTAIDPGVSPCVDLYAYACGGWSNATRIPDDLGTFFRTFSTQRRDGEDLERQILERDVSDPSAAEPGSYELGDFFAACEDTVAIEARTDADLRDLLDHVDTSTPDAFAVTVARLHALGVPAIFSFEPELDPRDATKTIALVRQPPLTLAENDYADPHRVADLRAHAARLFWIAADSPARAEEEARDAIGIETALAAKLESRLVFHDPEHALRVISGANLAAIQPNFRWNRYFDETKIDPNAGVHLVTESYLHSAGALLSSVSSRKWRAFLRWQLLQTMAPYATAAYREEDFRFASTKTGATSPAERWRTCVQTTEQWLGDALFDVYAASVSSVSDRERAMQIATAVVERRRDLIRAEAWSSVDNRERAHRKAAGLRIRIGQPAQLPGAHVPFDRHAFFLDVLRARESVRLRSLARIGKPPSDRAVDTGSFMPNASFDPRRNRIDLGVTLLRSPAFANESLAAELGGLGSIVGHELLHPFDRTGWRFDEAGNFDALAALHPDRALAFASPWVSADIANTSIDGKPLRLGAVLDEAMADVTGLEVAYRALSYLTRESTEPVIDRDRAFFTAYAQLWCAKMRPQALQTFLEEDPHLPPSVRVDESVAYLGEFGTAFGCSPDSPMLHPPTKHVGDD